MAVAPKPVPRTVFGKRLRAELDRQNLSVRHLARRMQPENPEPMRRSIARWLSPEATAVNPSRVSVDAIAEALGVTRETLSSDDDEEEAALLQPLYLAVREIVRVELERIREPAV